ncbi:MAG: phosphatase PAP2 family protein [Methylomonas sp.]|jgi:membrane-associated PAP2 superfamily phosphatase|uniref:phosphatase PAP2 family protein n=1 Tax=Methylomonas sp. TaxID=418 RepID=UPI0025D6B0BF|nr:phosphatase PAP2 family protein [Methylomonas sp.]MCK9605633.1 phosphatase PAP2 family protein [Methylomonas sp.]
MPHRKIKRAKRELLVWLFLVVTTTLLFWFTNLDTQLAALFYHPGHSIADWPYQQWPLLKFLYNYAFPFTLIAGSSALTVYISSHFHRFSRRFSRRALYILLVIAIGPGLVVNLIFKDHWGRPRPVHIQPFGGEYTYVPPLKLGHTPDKSFVCGHCSVGYAFFALYFLSQNHKALYFTLTLVLAWLMGFTRMTAGGHFVSDILWSGYLVFLVAYALYYGWFVRVKAGRPEGRH